jgi:hypothetical protein
VDTSLHTDEWLIDVLRGDGPLDALLAGGVYSELIPANKPLPSVRFQLQAGREITVVNGVNIYTDLLYLVAAVVEGSPAALVPIADRIDAVLHKAVGETSTIRVQSCVREMPFRLRELLDGKLYRHAGGLYRIKVQPK